MKQHKKELIQHQHAIKLAVQTERERCAQIAEDYKQRALQDGMLMPAAVGKIIAEAIRTS